MPELLKTVGRYELLREVGRGGMATVYLARQRDLDRFVALKELSAFHASDTSFAQRFLRESRVAGSLSHPNIVTVHDYVEHEGTPYIAMEYLDRGSLRPWVRSLTPAQVVGVLEGVLAGLAHAEQHGIVHRDLKPENLMVTGDGRVKIADFGIAKAKNKLQTQSFLTATGMTVGTPTYMAPEQAMAREVGPWTDLYSLGCMAFEMLVGRAPFADTEAPMAILLRHVNEAVPPPRAVEPSVDPELSAWVERLVVKDPAARTRSAVQAWDELEEIVIGLVGPRWRREARLVARGEAATPAPLPPAPFEEVDPGEDATPTAEPASDEFESFRWGAPAGGTTDDRDVPPPPPPGPATPPPLTSPVGELSREWPVGADTPAHLDAAGAPQGHPPEAVEGEVVAPEAQASAGAAPAPATPPAQAGDDEFVTFAPGPRGVAEDGEAAREQGAEAARAREADAARAREAEAAAAAAREQAAEAALAREAQQVRAALQARSREAAAARALEAEAARARAAEDARAREAQQARAAEQARARDAEPARARGPEAEGARAGPAQAPGSAPSGAPADDAPAFAPTVAPRALPPQPAGAVAAEPSATRTSGRTATLAALGVGVLVAAVAGVLAGRAESERPAPRTAAAGPQLASGPLALRAPAGTTRTARAPEVPGLRLADAAAVTGAGGLSIVLGTAGDDAANPALLPARVLRPAGGARPPQGERVVLGDRRTQALRHADLPVRGQEQQLRAYAVPTSAGVGVVACLLPPKAPRAAVAGCDAAAATLRLTSGRAFPVGPDAAHARRLGRVLAPLDRAAAAGVDGLGDARTRRGQAARAAELASAWSSAAGRLRGVERLSPADRAPTLALRDALRATGEAYRAAAAAARAGDAARYRAAGGDLNRARADVREALEGLEAAGYAVAAR